jgi:hypothetical protein
MDYLQLFLDEDIIERITNETNLYAEQCLTNPNPLKLRSRAKRWQPVSTADIWVFIRIVILQGVGKPNQDWYWSINKLTETSFFATVMTEARFALIMIPAFHKQ